jgi:hypothetical protein
VIKRLIYDNLDPLTALAAAAARRNRIALQSTVINVHPRKARCGSPSSSLRGSGHRASA